MSSQQNETPQAASNKKTIALWATGLAPFRILGREAKNTAMLVKWNTAAISKTVKATREEAKQDIQAAKTDPEGFWDDVVTSAGVTEKSLRSRYKLAFYGSYALLVVMAGSLGMLAGTLGILAMTIGNLVLLNILVMMYIANVHRLYSAREQRLITIPQFLKLAMKIPALLMPQPLPDSYKLREQKKTKPSTAANDSAAGNSDGGSGE
jgi:hypothetical protein